jgi:hypothetical protein
VSPVRSTRSGDQRSLVLAVSGLVLALVLLLVLFVFAIPNLTSSDKVEVQLGPERFDARSADDRAEEIAERGPILLPDVAGNDRDVFLQHLGGDPATGWLAFDARLPDASRDCSLSWQPATRQFVGPCDGTAIDEKGTGLRQYTVEVTDEGNVVLDLRAGD